MEIQQIHAIRPNPDQSNLIVINATGQDLNMGNPEQLDDVSKAMIDVNIAQNFGPCFFNLQDPYYLEHKNIPRPLDSSIHKWVLIANLYLICSVAAGAVCYAVYAFPTSPIVGPVIIICQGYVIYAIIAIFCSESRGYIMNVKPWTEYQSTYEKMVQGQPGFRFYITCYHYETRRDSKGRTRRVKVTTHTASQDYHPLEWND